MSINLKITTNEINAIEQFFQSIEEKWGSLYLTTQNPSVTNIYNYYPYLFVEIFDGIHADVMQRFTVCARLFSSSVFLMDCILDGDFKDLERLTGNALRSQVMQFESYRILFDIFPANTNLFWHRFRAFLQDFTNAIVEEKRICGVHDLSSYSDDEMIRRIIIGKNGMSRVIVAGLSELSNREDCYAILVRSTEHFYVARQICDDLLDFRKDIAKNKVSIATLRFFCKYPDLYSKKKNERLLEELIREFYYGGHAELLLNEAVFELQQAVLVIENLPQSGWHYVINSLQNECLSLKNDISKIILKNLQQS